MAIRTSARSEYRYMEICRGERERPVRRARRP